MAEAFRDFTTATEWLRQADAVDANHPWLIYAWSSLLERQDRYEEALERGRQAMAQRTVFRPGVQQVAHLLQVLDRDEEALELFTVAGAYTTFEEHIKGAIRPGMLADFAVLERDPRAIDPMTLAELKITRTVIGGESVYEA